MTNATDGMIKYQDQDILNRAIEHFVNEFGPDEIRERRAFESSLFSLLHTLHVDSLRQANVMMGHLTRLVETHNMLQPFVIKERKDHD